MLKLVFLILAEKNCHYENGICKIPLEYVTFIPDGLPYWKDNSTIESRKYIFFDLVPEDLGFSFGGIAENFLLRVDPPFIEWIFTCGIDWYAKAQYAWIWPIMCNAFGCMVNTSVGSKIELVWYDKTLTHDPDYDKKYEGVYEVD